MVFIIYSYCPADGYDYLFIAHQLVVIISYLLPN